MKFLQNSFLEDLVFKIFELQAVKSAEREKQVKEVRELIFWKFIDKAGKKLPFDKKTEFKRLLKKFSTKKNSEAGSQDDNLFSFLEGDFSPEQIAVLVGESAYETFELIVNSFFKSASPAQVTEFLTFFEEKALGAGGK